MNVLTRIIVILVISLLPILSNSQSGYSITVKVENVDNNEGKMFIALYKSEVDFLDSTYKGAKTKIENKTSEFTFKDIPEGVYAVSIFHDENDNGKMDTNFVGIPKEAYGCSNNASGFMGPPKWKDAKFELNENKSIVITLK